MDIQVKARLISMINAPYDMEQRPFDAIMADPAFRLHSAKNLEAGGRALVEVEFSCDGQEDHKIKSAKVQLDPNLDWAIRKFELRYDHLNFKCEVDLSGFVEYADGMDGSVVPTRIFHKSEVLNPNRRHPVESRDLKISHLSSNELTPDQFELPAFGLPDLPTEPLNSSNWFSLRGWVFWTMVVISVGSFLALQILRRLTRIS